MSDHSTSIVGGCLIVSMFANGIMISDRLSEISLACERMRVRLENITEELKEARIMESKRNGT